MYNIRSYADNMQLRRGDIIYVPRSGIAEVGLFVQQYFRDALPFTLDLSYNLGDGFSGNN
jgi:polysaccharide export outer membrane protein